MTWQHVDALEERAAIMAEANGWSQGRAERVLAHEAGCVSWGQLLSRAKKAPAEAGAGQGGIQRPVET